MCDIFIVCFVLSEICRFSCFGWNFNAISVAAAALE